MSMYLEIESRFIVVNTEFVRNAAVTEKYLRELSKVRQECMQAFKLNTQYEAELMNLREIKTLNSQLLIERDNTIYKLKEDLQEMEENYNHSKLINDKLNFEYKKFKAERQKANQTLQLMNNDKSNNDTIITELRNEIIRQEKKIQEYIESMKEYSKNSADVFNLRDL